MTPLTEYLTEQEQIEILKNWVKQYSLVIIAGVLIAVVGISGWRYWQQRQAKILSHASAIYSEMLTLRANHDEAGTEAQASKLASHYTQTTYARMAALMLARNAEANGDFNGAKNQLQSVIDHSRVNSFRQIARIRLARLLIAQHQAQQALNILSTVDDKAFDGLTDEARGDAWLAKNDINEARKAYRKALAELPEAEVVRPLLRMKYDNLATTL